MCLHKIIGKPEKTSGIGYKAFKMNTSGKLQFPYFNPDGKDSQFYPIESIELNTKYVATKSVEDSISGKTYKTGFHIFTSAKSAQKWGNAHRARIIVKVKYTKARLAGYQGIGIDGDKGFKCIIADEIILLEIL